MSEWLAGRLGKIRSLKGWQDMWNDKQWGNDLRQISIEFFGKSYAFSYIMNSKIKRAYKNSYLS